MLYQDVWGYLLGQDIPATVIPVYPGRTRLVYTARFERRVVYGIVYPYQLAQGVVLVSGNVPVPGLARYVAPAVIGVSNPRIGVIVVSDLRCPVVLVVGVLYCLWQFTLFIPYCV